MGLTLAEHILKSREVVAANKAKGNRHAELLANMYAQPSRFIEEILQNTEDAYSRKKSDEPEKKIRFKLLSDSIEIHHNGKNFDEADLMSVTTFANTTKKNHNEVNLIGKFGIGFKSVFSITDAPEIHCEPYHYSITDYEVLEETRQKKPNKNFNTLIILPFKKKNQKDSFEAVNKGLNELNEFSLLFLKQITIIEIFIDEKLTVTIERKVDEINNTLRVISLEKTFYNSAPYKEISNYFVFSRQARSEKQQAELAFKFIKENENIHIIPINNAPLFVYFPTRMNSRLSFIINAPFTTNPLREYIPFDTFRAPENIKIIDETLVLFSKALETMVQKGWFSIKLISMLPIKVEKENELNKTNDLWVYQKFYETLLDYFKTKSAIPVSAKKYARIDNVIIPHDYTISGLLNTFDLQKLYQKKYFADPEISEKPYNEVLKYFVEVLQIKTADPESFGFRILIDTGFLHDKKLDWLKQFYKYIYKNQILWDVQHSGNYYSLRNAAIFLTQNYGFQQAFDAEKKLKIFLPGKKCFLAVIHKKLLNDKDCRSFFDELGIGVPEPADDVEFNIIPQIGKQTLSYGKEYIKNIEKILEVYNSAPVLRKEKIIELLKNISWVYCLTSDSGKEHFFKKPDETYINSPDISGYFENNKSAFIVEQGLYKKLNKKFQGAYHSLLEATGVLKFPRLIISENKIIEIEGFEFFLKNISLNRSLALIKLLLALNPENFSADFQKFLRYKSWIYTRNKLFESADNIKTSEFSPLYKLQNAEKNKLYDLLGIIETQTEIKAAFVDWYPTVQPEDVSIIQNQSFKEKSDFNADLFSVANVTALSFAKQTENITANQVYSDEDMAKIHLWSCSFVENMLQKTKEDRNFIIVTSEHADMELIKEGKVSEYIFVCGKTDLLNYFPLKPRQLTEICRLFSSGETTFLYLVDSAGKKNASVRIIQNPFDLIINGKLPFGGAIWISALF